MSKNLANPSYLEALSSDLYESVMAAIRPVLKQQTDLIANYLSGNFDDALLDDLDSQRKIAREFNISPGRITQLIKENKLRTYTAKRLIRRSEMKHYLANKKK